MCALQDVHTIVCVHVYVGVSMHAFVYVSISCVHNSNCVCYKSQI